MGIKAKFEKRYFDFYGWTRKVSAQKKRIKEFKHKKCVNHLTAEQKSQVKQFYKKYKVPNMVFHEFFTDKTGEFHVEYIPQDIYVGYIDPYFNDILAKKFIDNKCNYDALFHGIPQCECIMKRVNNIWLDGKNKPLSPACMSEVLEKIQCNIFVKEAQVSGGGRGISYVNKDEISIDKILEIANKIKTDIIVQKELIQHKNMAHLNDSSVNSLRVYSLLEKDGTVKIYSAVVRMGLAGSKVDNYAAGGVSCGIDENGKLRKLACNKLGERMTEHPTSHVRFENYPVPFYEDIKKLVYEAHPRIAHFRSVSWDIAIREDGVPILIEANLCRGGIDLLQICNGPLFGEDTEKILDEVFKR